MLSEDEARRLLARAADTIDVPPGPPIEAQPRPRRPWLTPLLAAASVVAVIGAGVGLGALWSPGRDLPTATPTNEPRYVPEGVIPAVVAYDAASAKAILEDLGLTVLVEKVPACEVEGRALRTEPGAGRAYQPGDVVYLQVTTPHPTAFCINDHPKSAWGLLDFANGRGPAPTFADTVTVDVNGTLTEISGADAANPETWADGSALDLLATATLRTQYLPSGGGAVDLGLDVRTPADLSTCGWSYVDWRGDPGDGVRIDATINIAFLIDGYFDSGCFTTALTVEGEAISAIHVGASGLFLEPLPTYPLPQWTEKPENPDPQEAGARFLAFARGEIDDPGFADEVRLFRDNVRVATLSGGETLRRAEWGGCLPYDYCSMPLLDAIADLLPTRPAVTDFVPTGCLYPAETAPTDLEGSAYVVLGIPEPRTCADDVAVQIWYDDAGLVTGVNLLMGKEHSLDGHSVPQNGPLSSDPFGRSGARSR
jgi:hypothetical protein